MTLSILKVGSAPIPFRTAFGHASATRGTAENILVYVEDANGVFGLGEGCPRSYVTGESVETAGRFLERYRGEFLALSNVGELRTWLGLHTPEVDENPSAFCAIELALLDLFSRQARLSIDRFLGMEPQFSHLTASAVYGTGAGLKFHAQRLLFRLNGMHNAKLKLSGDVRRDTQRAAQLAKHGRVRLDANNYWQKYDDAVNALRRLSPYAWAVEEPVQPRDWSVMAQIVEQTGLAIIADESFTQARDLETMPKEENFIPNFRVSKLGGLIRSIAALELALRQGRKIIVGAQVGETSILARAGMVLAAAAGRHLVGYEGAYGVRLLKWDLGAPTIGFGFNGMVGMNTTAIGAPGLGLNPTNALMEAVR